MSRITVPFAMWQLSGLCRKGSVAKFGVEITTPFDEIIQEHSATGWHSRTSELPGNIQLDNGLTMSKSALNESMSGAIGFASAVEARFVQSLGKRRKAADNQAIWWHGRTSELSGNLQLDKRSMTSKSTLNESISGATGFASAVEG